MEIHQLAYFLHFVITSGPIRSVGNQVDRNGKYVTKIKNINIILTNGIAARITSATDISATPAVTNKLSPTGGVIIPISIFTTIIMPR